MNMDVKTLKDIPPWEWPESTSTTLLNVLRDEGATESDLSIAVQLSGDLVVMNDELAAALIDIADDSVRPENIRAQAAVAFGAVLEEADLDGFEDSEVRPISRPTFRRIEEVLRRLHQDVRVPREVRRMALEAAVRAPREWHKDAVQAAFASDEEAWRLTAIFCAQYVRGFDDQILEALDSADPEILYEAVVAAGKWELDAAWPHVAAILTASQTDKPLLLAAIAAVGTIRPHEAARILGDFMDSDDEDIVAEVEEALAMAEGLSGDAADGDDDDDMIE
jgi:uncharacterized protein (UPF0147 family)